MKKMKIVLRIERMFRRFLGKKGERKILENPLDIIEDSELSIFLGYSPATDRQKWEAICKRDSINFSGLPEMTGIEKAAFAQKYIQILLLTESDFSKDGMYKGKSLSKAYNL